MAIQLINISINTGDKSHYEDLSVNEIETCIELVVEIFLGQENAMEESGEHEHSGARPGYHLLLFAYKTDCSLAPLNPEIIAKVTSDDTVLSIQTHNKTIEPPPPWT